MKKNGFTLLELVISLLILGLLFAGILGPLSTRVEQKERQSTQEILDEIKESLYGFAMMNGRLPCPDTDTPADGIENDCTAGTPPVSGVLPWTTLGISGEDSWGNPLTYQVTQSFADTTDGGGCVAPLPPATVGVSFQLCSIGDITINDEAGSNVVLGIPAVVFSGGKENYTGSSLETENTNNDAIFAYTDYRQETNKEFDDLMIWISPNILKNRMVQAGRLP